MKPTTISQFVRASTRISLSLSIGALVSLTGVQAAQFTVARSLPTSSATAASLADEASASAIALDTSWSKRVAADSYSPVDQSSAIWVQTAPEGTVRDPSLTHSTLRTVEIELTSSATGGSTSVPSTPRGAAPFQIPTLLLQDDFSSYALGGFPSSGGWQQPFGPGAIVPDGGATTNSLRMVGSYCWAAVAYHPIALPRRVRFATNVYVESISQPGCDGGIGAVGFYDPPTQAPPWGAAYDCLLFQADGTIQVLGGPVLQPYSSSHWYHIVINADFSSGRFDVAIDGVVYPGISGTTQAPSGIWLTAGHGTAPDPALRFDDVLVIGK
jgi:hypothetical protein